MTTPPEHGLFTAIHILATAFENIVRNALRYSNSALRLHLLKNQGIIIIVDDDGPGVSPEDRVYLPTVLPTDEARDRVGGTGLD